MLGTERERERHRGYISTVINKAAYSITVTQVFGQDDVTVASQHGCERRGGGALHGAGAPYAMERTEAAVGKQSVALCTIKPRQELVIKAPVASRLTATNTGHD